MLENILITNAQRGAFRSKVSQLFFFYFFSCLPMFSLFFIPYLMTRQLSEEQLIEFLETVNTQISTKKTTVTVSGR